MKENSNIKMKALSLKQPYAELILQKRKTIELRKWNTNFRGKFLIHSSKLPDKEAIKQFNLKNLKNGYILGTAELTEVKYYKSKKQHLKDKNKHLANKNFGNYGFILKNIKRIKPIKAKGKLNFWEFIPT